MNKKYVWLTGAACLLLGLGICLHKSSRHEPAAVERVDIQTFLDSLNNFSKPESIGMNDLEQEHIKTVDQSVVPYLVPSLCGYNPRNLQMGILTVRRDIDSLVYAKAFPKSNTLSGNVDSIKDVYLYIEPMDIFPKGEYGRVAYVLSNDSFIQVQFLRGGVDEMVQNVSNRLDEVSNQLQDLVRQMEKNGENR